MGLRCRLGFHRWRAYDHRLGQPWVFYEHCLRCWKRRTEAFQLPPQNSGPWGIDRIVELRGGFDPPIRRPGIWTDERLAAITRWPDYAVDE